MREVKFRGLSAKGEMVYGFLTKDLPNSTLYYSEYSYRIHWETECGKGTVNCPVKNGTVGQFTGLHDKNGVEIYEGDIVRAQMTSGVGGLGEWIGSVDFHDFEYCIETTDLKWPLASWKCVLKAEVIGNIYKHPHLLSDER